MGQVVSWFFPVICHTDIRAARGVGSSPGTQVWPPPLPVRGKSVHIYFHFCVTKSVVEGLLRVDWFQPTVLNTLQQVQMHKNIPSSNRPRFSEPVWPSGKVLYSLVSRKTWVQFRFGFPLSAKVVLSGRYLVTPAPLPQLWKTIMALITAHRNAGVIVVVTV